jgi:hypothetical protein
MQTNRQFEGQCFKNGSANESGLYNQLPLLRTPYLQFVGNKSFLWSPTVHSAAIRTLGKCNSVRQPIDLRKINIDVRRDQFFRIWTFEHQLRQRDLQILSEDAESFAGVAVFRGVPSGDEDFDRTCIIVI